jgi:hypothetical protein
LPQGHGALAGRRQPLAALKRSLFVADNRQWRRERAMDSSGEALRRPILEKRPLVSS